MQIGDEQNDTESRFDMACARCSTGIEILEEKAVVTDSGRIPVCEPLPPGTDDSATGVTLASINILPGYYRSLSNSTDVRECYQYEACKGGDVAREYCADGYEGACE